jgi:transposase-like protein
LRGGANTAVIESVNSDAYLDIELRWSKYLNNMVEQDHRGVKRITNPMLGLECTNHHRRHRGNAHDQQGAVAMP